MPAPRAVRGVATAARLIGVEPRRVQASLRGLPVYLRNRREYTALDDAAAAFPLGTAWPCLADRYEESGTASGQYFHQDLLIAQLVHRAAPERHVDVGSRVDGFVAHVAAFRTIEVLDIRPLRTTAENIVFHQADVTEDVSAFHASADSVSCLHALEHFGLGRYGDPLDPDGWRRGFDNLGRILRTGGTLYLSVPLGRQQRVEFDAHRIFSLPFVLTQMVADRYRLDRFAYVDDAGELHRDVDVTTAAAERSFDLHMGCGILILTKL